MKKIISLYQRNYETDGLVRDEIVPGAEWVINGEGVATRKYDGTCCMVKDGEIYARYDAKGNRTPPEGFIPAMEKDETTGHWTGWVKCKRGDNKYKWHFEAFDKSPDLEDGTYELCGEKVQSNPEGYSGHVLISHATAERLCDSPRTFEEIKQYLSGLDIEGIVWHHPDGRMVKIKGRDFGIKRATK